MSIKRVCALFLKEMQDLRRNGSITTMLLVPPLLTFLWSGVLHLPSEHALAIGALFAVVMIGVYSPAMMFAEEKEKHTLRVLMLSPATPGEILISKGLVVFAAIILVTLLLVPISGAEVQNWLLLGLILLSGSVFVIALGFIIGLISPNQMATGYTGMPVYLILLLIPMIGQQNAVLARLSRVIPSMYIQDGIQKALQGQSLASSNNDLLALGLAGIIALAVFIVLYRRSELNE